MIVTVEWIEKHYNKFNQLYFGGTLPRIVFKTSRTKKSWGYATYKYDLKNSTVIPESIVISNYYDSPEDVKIQTLLHEMIHIEDYFWHPEHFIRNGRPISGHYYNAHGIWFRNEARRISEESGYTVTHHVTKDEESRSTLSNNSKRLIDNKKQNARIIACYKDGFFWYFKTDVNNINNVRNLIKRYLPKYNKIYEFSFDYEPLACMRSCSSRLRGWKISYNIFMDEMMKFKATTLRTYYI